MLLAHITDFKREFAFNLLISVVGNADCARTGQRLHPCGYVNSVSVNVALVDNDVADINTDAKLDPTIFGNFDVPLHRPPALDFHGAARGVDSACKLDQSTVSRRLDYTTSKLRNLGVNQFTPARLERSESAFLVNTHLAAVTGDIRR